MKGNNKMAVLTDKEEELIDELRDAWRRNYIYQEINEWSDNTTVLSVLSIDEKPGDILEAEIVELEAGSTESKRYTRSYEFLDYSDNPNNWELKKATDNDE